MFNLKPLPPECMSIVERLMKLTPEMRKAMGMIEVDPKVSAILNREQEALKLSSISCVPIKGKHYGN